MTSADPDEFRAAMAGFPTGVTIVTTRDPAGTPWGFTASSFCSVSLEPPMVLVCLSRAANSYPAFRECGQFAISILQAHHRDLAHRFASKRPDKFAVAGLTRTPGGLAVVEDAIAVLECTLDQRHDAGDHVILLGLVDSVRTAAGEAAVYVNRSFGPVRVPTA